VDERLRPWALGDWTGRPFADLEQAGLRADASYAEHGGESLLALHRRVDAQLADLQAGSGGGRTTVVAVTHGAVIKAAVVSALGAPAGAAWDIDVHPASVTELTTDGAGWRVVRVNSRYP
jgi:broad specificity phosphatase PhoE